MTTRTVLTLTELQLRFLRAAVAITLHTQGQAAAKLVFAGDRIPAAQRIAFADACDIGCFSICAPTGPGLPLDHQEGQDLLTLLELAESVELSATDTTADGGDDGEPMGFEAAFVDAAAAAVCRL